MSEKRIINFSAGPSTLPVEVLEKAKAQMLNYEGSGMSVMEMSHRSAAFEQIMANTQAKLRSLMNIPNNYKILFLQGGASTQFASIPLNLMKHNKADYIITGYFANNAYKEACKYGDIKIAGSSKDQDFSYIPTSEQISLRDDSDYVYLCSNNTIYGTEYKYDLYTLGKPLVADMSSNILSKEIDVSKYGLIFAGAQKNMGCAGLSVVIIREDLLVEPKSITPSMLSYKLMAEKDSMYNTPPTYSIYILMLMLEWIEKLGGIKVVEENNIRKATLLYDYIDCSNFYQNKVNKGDRSNMNITFTCGDENLDNQFINESKKAGMSNLKGHRAVGGMRASIYNAMTYENVEKLVKFMQKFAQERAQ